MQTRVWLLSVMVLVDGKARGVISRDVVSGKLERFSAHAVVLATGGIGRAYTATTNPVESTGDGLAMAARAVSTSLISRA